MTDMGANTGSVQGTYSSNWQPGRNWQ
jgi:hypothetical protein